MGNYDVYDDLRADGCLSVGEDAEILGTLSAGEIECDGIPNYIGQGELSHDSSSAVRLGAVPAGYTLVALIANVVIPFNAGGENTITVGDDSDASAFMGAKDIIATKKGGNFKSLFRPSGDEPLNITAKYTQSGAAATAGKCEFYAVVVRI